jgi:phytoene dehydrogenase-like protein
MDSRYDAIIIGAGFSGLAAALRCAMFEKKVLLLESHSIPGGLNSYYRRGKRKFDVGLHAMTNFAQKGDRRRPLGKILKQLRLPYDLLELKEQNGSRVRFPDRELAFSNDPELLDSEVERLFSSQSDGWRGLVAAIREFPLNEEQVPWQSARAFVRRFIKDPVLEDMLFCPLCYYGSAWEEDMDLPQFVIMFQSIFLEGFCRPAGGIRVLISWLMDRLKELGVDLAFRQPVSSILHRDGKVTGVELEKGGRVEAPKILSSVGFPETESLLADKRGVSRVGQLLFVETLLCFDSKPLDWGIEDTIIFNNDSDKFRYRPPESDFDPSSAVLCFSNNFSEDSLEEGVFRVTHLAGSKWPERGTEDYEERKKALYTDALDQLDKLVEKGPATPSFQDAFTPKTVEHFTRHHGGTIYGSPDKRRDGRTEIEGLYLIGTDQGYLGIVGSMLSGITMANHRVLMDKS